MYIYPPTSRCSKPASPGGQGTKAWEFCNNSADRPPSARPLADFGESDNVEISLAGTIEEIDKDEANEVCLDYPGVILWHR